MIGKIKKTIAIVTLLVVMPLYSLQLTDIWRASNRANFFAAAKTGMVSHLRESLPVVGINAVDHEGRSALIIALNNGKSEAADFLLQQPDIDINLKDQSGLTALEAAVRSGLTPLVVRLLNLGADIQPLITRHVKEELQEVVNTDPATLLAQAPEQERHLVDAFGTHKIEFEFSLQLIQTVFETFCIPVPTS